MRRAPEARLPVGQRERRADDVADLLGVVDVVGEVPGVPDQITTSVPWIDSWWTKRSIWARALADRW